MLSVIYEWNQTPPPEPPTLDGAHIILGEDLDGRAVSLDMTKLMSGRLLIQGPSGAGKSTLLRQIIKQCPIQWLAIDPEGEYGDDFHSQPPTTFSGETAALFCRQQRASMVRDLSDLPRERQLIYLTEFIHGLVEAPRSLWINQCLVVIDEVEIFTPQDTSAFDDPAIGKRSKVALIELMTRGRKRGLITIIATHRLAMLAASVRAEARNVLIGGSSFDIDIERAAKALGWSPKKAYEVIPYLKVGQFIASGPAFNQSPTIVKVPKP